MKSRVGENIKSMRTARGLTQQDLADALGVVKATVSSWERDRTEPNIGMIEKLCSVLHCKKSDIMDTFNLNNIIDSVTRDAMRAEFGSIRATTPISDDEIDLIMRYRVADKRIQRIVKTALEYIPKDEQDEN